VLSETTLLTHGRRQAPQDLGSKPCFEVKSIVYTIAARKVRTILQLGSQAAQLFEQKFYGLFEHIPLAFSLKASETDLIVATIAVRLVATKVSRLNCFQTSTIV
jgi:hypothetical protein